MILTSVNKRELIQKKCETAIRDSNYNGITIVSPRVGKSKILIDSIREKINWNIVIASPYEPIRQNWISEFTKWGLEYHPQSICFRSIDLIEKEIDLLIVDEIQTLSPHQIDVIRHKKPKRLLGLTGIIADKNILNLFALLRLQTIFTYTIDQAIADEIISNFEIIIVECDLDTKRREIPSGTKKRPFMASEAGHYNFLSYMFEMYKAQSVSKPKLESIKMMYAGARARFICASNSKIAIAKRLIASSERCIIFTGLKKVAEVLSPNSFHSGSPDPQNLERFIHGEINHLSAIDMTNMGITFPCLKTAIVHQLRSNPEMALQKVLRVCNLEDDKTASIYVTVYKDTVDHQWVSQAFQKVNPARIRRISHKDL